MTVEEIEKVLIKAAVYASKIAEDVQHIEDPMAYTVGLLAISKLYMEDGPDHEEVNAIADALVRSMHDGDPKPEGDSK